MSYRITDLLDDYMDSSVHLFPPEEVLSSSPADPDGVPNTPTPPQSRHRMKKPLVIAAALLLAVTGIAAGCLTLSRFPNGASLNTGLPELPESTPWNSPDSGQSVVESIPEDIVLDDTNSVIVTSEATGLSIRVPTEFQDELKTDNSFTLTTIYSDDESFDFDSIFTFCDSSNQDNSNGIVFSIYAWNQSAFQIFLCGFLGHLADFVQLLLGDVFGVLVQHPFIVISIIHFACYLSSLFWSTAGVIRLIYLSFFSPMCRFLS